MPIDVCLDKERRLVIATVRGDVRTEDILGAIDRAVRHPDFEPGFGVLSDHTGVGEPLTAEQARLMVGHLEELQEVMAGARWAVVTTKAASYGMLRMVSVLAQRVPMEVQVFSDPTEAEAWLVSGTRP